MRPTVSGEPACSLTGCVRPDESLIESSNRSSVDGSESRAIGTDITEASLHAAGFGKNNAKRNFGRIEAAAPPSSQQHRRAYLAQSRKNPGTSAVARCCACGDRGKDA